MCTEFLYTKHFTLITSFLIIQNKRIWNSEEFMKKGVVGAFILVLVIVGHFVVAPPVEIESAKTIAVDWPKFVLSGIPFELTVALSEKSPVAAKQAPDSLHLVSVKSRMAVQLDTGK